MKLDGEEGGWGRGGGGGAACGAALTQRRACVQFALLAQAHQLQKLDGNGEAALDR